MNRSCLWKCLGSSEDLATFTFITYCIVFKHWNQLSSSHQALTAPSILQLLAAALVQRKKSKRRTRKGFVLFNRFEAWDSWKGLVCLYLPFFLRKNFPERLFYKPMFRTKTPSLCFSSRIASYINSMLFRVTWWLVCDATIGWQLGTNRKFEWETKFEVWMWGLANLSSPSRGLQASYFLYLHLTSKLFWVDSKYFKLCFFRIPSKALLSWNVFYYFYFSFDKITWCSQNCARSHP